MENKNNQCFVIDESDELTKLKILNSALIKELRKYKEENTKLKHEKEILNSIIENLEEENKALKSDFSSMKNQDPHGENMDIVENMLQSNHEIKEEKLDYYDNDTKNESNKDEAESLPLEKFKCEICKKETSSNYKLNLHKESVHEGLKKYKCDNCGKNFAQNIGLKTHITAVHEKIKIQL